MRSFKARQKARQKKIESRPRRKPVGAINKGKFNHKDLKPIGQVYLNPNYTRENTKHDRHLIHFVFSQGGLGDYINWMPAMEYIAKEIPQVKGRLFVNPPFDEVAKYILRDTDFEVYTKEEIPKVTTQTTPVNDPADYGKYISAVGAHLLDLGFMYYANMNPPPPAYNRMPDLKSLSTGEHYPHFIALKGIKKYAVFTPGATADNRRMRGKYLNELCRYTLGKGIMPVFLGKKDFALAGPESDYYATADEDFDPSLGIDLREKTTLLEAVSIIQEAEFICGVDNGLLHFAGCTEVPIIFGHTITEIHHRQIRRPIGKTINIALTKESLACSGCQSNVRFIFGHRFKHCMYGDYVCLDALFADNCAFWKRAIDNVLGG